LKNEIFIYYDELVISFGFLISCVIGVIIFYLTKQSEHVLYIFDDGMHFLFLSRRASILMKGKGKGILLPVFG